MPISRITELVVSDACDDVADERRDADRGEHRREREQHRHARRRRTRRTRAAGSANVSGTESRSACAKSLPIVVVRARGRALASPNSAIGKRGMRPLHARRRRRAPAGRARRRVSRVAPEVELRRARDCPSFDAPAPGRSARRVGRAQRGARRRQRTPERGRRGVAVRDWTSTLSLARSSNAGVREDLLGARRLAVALLGIRQLFRARDRAEQRPPPTTSAEPPEGRGLPVRGAPAPGAGCDVVVACHACPFP